MIERTLIRMQKGDFSMQQSPVAMRNEKLGRTVCEALKKHGFDAFWCATKEDARKKALELIREGRAENILLCGQ